MPAAGTARSRFGQIVRSHLASVRREIALAALCILGSSATALVAPWPIKFIFDQVLLDKPLPDYLGFLAGWLHGGSVQALALLAGALVAIAFFTGIFAYWQIYLTSRVGYRLVYRLRSELFDHLQRLSLSFHNRARTGELLSKMTSDTNMLKDVYAASSLTFATNVVTIAGMFAVMLALNVPLALVVLATFPLLGAVLFLVLRKVRKAARRQRRNEGKVASRIGEILMAVPLVQAFGRESYERERFENESAQSMEDSIRAARMEAAATRLVEIVTAVGTGVAVVFGGLQVLRGGMTPGDLLVFVSYIHNIYRPVRTMARLSARFSKAGASAERIREILEIEPEIQDAPDAIEAVSLRGEVAFENVSFGYEDGKQVLRDVSFSIPAGRRVALVGASGAGKSTIANLIIRLYDATAGRVLIDGVDVRQYRRESLRREVGVVLQEAILFGTTIRENITYGRPEATDEEVEAAARQVHAHDFISGLPEGYDEILGEGGGTLSGGQRQRICLARALIKQPSILIMDEPTSAVDADSEAAIRDAVQRLQAGKTTLLIAHQLYSVQDADWVLALKDGRIVEQGPPGELARTGGYFCELFRIDPANATEIRRAS